MNTGGVMEYHKETSLSQSRGNDARARWGSHGSHSKSCILCNRNNAKMEHARPEL